jgi:uncharacterized protein (TIGR00369 family)
MADQTHDDIMTRLNSRFHSAHHRWVGAYVTRVEEEWVEAECPWKPEFEGAPNTAQGGILATLVDMAAEYAIAAKFGRPVPTINLRIDYHRPARPGMLYARGRVIRAGSTIITAEARVLDSERALCASGRGSFFSIGQFTDK